MISGIPKKYKKYTLELSFDIHALSLNLTIDNKIEMFDYGYKMMEIEVDKINTTLWNYMDHRLHAKVQFYRINSIRNSMKTDGTKVLVVIEHKQKILQMKYR